MIPIIWLMQNQVKIKSAAAALAVIDHAFPWGVRASEPEFRFRFQSHNNQKPAAQHPLQTCSNVATACDRDLPFDRLGTE